jgi:hypothetical protein
MRKLLTILGLVLFFAVWGENISPAVAGYSNLTLPWIKYQGGNDNPRPEALRSLLAQVTRRTSIEVNREPVALNIYDPELFRHPFIYMGGDEAFDPFQEKDLKILRNYLSYGGFLLIDDNSAQVDSAFDTSVRKMVLALFPQNPLRKIPRDHSIFRSFYLLNSVSGRSIVKPYLRESPLKEGLSWYTVPTTRGAHGHATNWGNGIMMWSPEATGNDNFPSVWGLTSLCTR